MDDVKFEPYSYAGEPCVLITLKPDGTYELGAGGVEGLLASEYPLHRAFGQALRDQYEAGFAAGSGAD